MDIVWQITELLRWFGSSAVFGCPRLSRLTPCAVCRATTSLSCFDSLFALKVRSLFHLMLYQCACSKSSTSSRILSICTDDPCFKNFLVRALILILCERTTSKINRPAFLTFSCARMSDASDILDLTLIAERSYKAADVMYNVNGLAIDEALIETHVFFIFSYVLVLLFFFAMVRKDFVESWLTTKLMKIARMKI